MNTAQRLLAKAKNRVKELKTERQADRAVLKMSKKNERTIYRQELVKERAKVAKSNARAKARRPSAGTRLKKELGSLKKANAKRENKSPFSASNQGGMFK